MSNDTPAPRTPAQRDFPPGGRTRSTPSSPATFLAAAGLAGALLLALALLFDRAILSPASWEGPLSHDPERGDVLPRCTVPLKPGGAVSLTLYWKGGVAARLRLHVRTDEGMCLGEREIALATPGPGRAGSQSILVRAAAEGSSTSVWKELGSAPHTVVWESLEGAPDEITLRVREGGPHFPAVPLSAAAAAFALAGIAGLALGGTGGSGRPCRVRISWGAGMGILLALGVLASLAGSADVLALQAVGAVEDP